MNNWRNAGLYTGDTQLAAWITRIASEKNWVILCGPACEYYWIEPEYKPNEGVPIKSTRFIDVWADVPQEIQVKMSQRDGALPTLVRKDRKETSDVMKRDHVEGIKFWGLGFRV